jgi:hypothetical protein
MSSNITYENVILAYGITEPVVPPLRSEDEILEANARLALPDIHNLTLGDYVTYYSHETASLGWGRVREWVRHNGRAEKFVENELLPKADRIRTYLPERLLKGELFAYRFPDEKTNVLMRELPQESVHEMLGISDNRKGDYGMYEDCIGNLLEKNDLISYVGPNSGLKLGRVGILNQRENKIFINPLHTVGGPRIQAHSSRVSLFQVSPEARKQIQSLSDQEIHDFYFQKNGSWR